jgi:DNA-binding NarL/FixJ family response regulator
VFLYDEQATVREGLRTLIERETDFDIVGMAATSAEALEGVAQTSPRVVIVDVGQTEKGVELCRDMLTIHPQLKCLVLAAFDEEGLLLVTLLAGAAGYLSEHPGREEVEAAIRGAAAGQRLLAPAVAARRAATTAAQSEARVLFESLSDQERRILELIAQGLTNSEIGELLHLATKTVRNYVSRLLAKLQVPNRTVAAVLMATLATESARLDSRPGSE